MTLIVTKCFNKEQNETKSVYENLKVAKKTLEEWMKEDETSHMDDKNSKDRNDRELVIWSKNN